MNTVAYMLDRNRPTAPDLLYGWFVYMPAIATLVCCYLLARSRAYLGYALGAAAVPGVFVLARVLLVYTRWDLGVYGSDDFTSAAFVVGFPFVAVALFHYFPPYQPNKGARANAHGQSSSAHDDPT